jgi:hypothetical protein
MKQRPVDLPKKRTSLASKITSGIKKGAGKVAHGAQVAGATASLAARVTNPYNVAKTAVNAARGKGLVLPGSNYIGPGNEMIGKKPTSKNDEAAFKHDTDYGDYLKAGVKAKDLYGGFSDADQRLMDRADLTKYDGVAAYAGMGIKKLKHKITGSKRIKDPTPTQYAIADDDKKIDFDKLKPGYDPNKRPPKPSKRPVKKPLYLRRR